MRNTNIVLFPHPVHLTRAEALEYLRLNGLPLTYNQIARKATGRPGPRTRYSRTGKPLYHFRALNEFIEAHGKTPQPIDFGYWNTSNLFRRIGS